MKRFRHPQIPRDERRTAGFTLIELLFVVATIAILAAMAVPNFLEAQIRSKRSETEQSLAILATALEAYQLDHGHLPPNEIDDPSDPKTLPLNCRALRRLTTPVAHLGALPQDLFWYHRSYPGIEKTPAWPGPKNTFLYWRFDPDAVEKGSVPFGVLISCGPDTEPSWRITTDTLAVATYDPSNGSTSGGDLFVVLPDSHPVPFCEPQPE
ncbi:type II secretion system protein [Candidatus Sumerlaeota bacterium]|nr:type II secretion system protein [Candidatus Sumerlaeota bacterium]